MHSGFFSLLFTYDFAETRPGDKNVTALLMHKAYKPLWKSFKEQEVLSHLWAITSG